MAELYVKHKIRPQNYCWILQLSHFPIKHRIKENYSVHDFDLTADEMTQMNNLDKGAKARTFVLDFLKSDSVDITTLPTWPGDERDQY